MDSVRFDLLSLDPSTQLLRENHVHVASGSEPTFTPVMQRLAWPAELDLMARIAGLRLTRAMGRLASTALHGRTATTSSRSTSLPPPGSVDTWTRRHQALTRPASGVSDRRTRFCPSGRENSILSIGSKNSILSVGSAGSILSIGSAAAFASLLSIGSFASVASTLSSMSLGSLLSHRGRRGLMSAGR